MRRFSPLKYLQLFLFAFLTIIAHKYKLRMFSMRKFRKIREKIALYINMLF